MYYRVAIQYERLVALKNTYDQTNFFALKQNSKPLTNERIEDEQVGT